MTKMTITTALIVGFALSVASQAAAQAPTTKGYVEANVAGQTQSFTLTTNSAVALFNEAATASSTQTIGKGILFDGGAGYTVWNDFAVGVSVSVFSRSATGAVSATVPSPVVYGAFTTMAASPKLATSEVGTHIKFRYTARVNSKLDFAVSAGPSFVRLEKDIADVSIGNGTPTVNVTTQTGTAVGGNAGLEMNYRFMPRIGGGIFARYVRARVDLPAASGVKVGGFQGGVGIRLHF